MRRFAEGTVVPVERSRVRIEALLKREGASHIGTMTEPDKATVYCRMKNRELQLRVPLNQSERETRRRWRVLLLTLKANFEAVHSGLVTFDRAFLSYVVVPGSANTIGELLAPRLDALYKGLGLKALLADTTKEGA